MKNLAPFTFALVLISMTTTVVSVHAQKKSKKSVPAEAATPKPEEKKSDKGGMKSYKEIITDKAVTDKGLFSVHKVNDRYFFEIPDSITSRELLLITKTSGFVENLDFGGAGMSPKDEHVVRWEKFDNTKILLRVVSYHNVASEQLPIYQSVKYNNFEPVLFSFDIKAINPDSTGSIIDVSDLFTTDVDLLSPLSNDQRKDFGIRTLDRSRCFINGIKSFPENVEARAVLTYAGTQLPDNQQTNSLSLEVNHSFVLLPKTPMMPRLFDKRVGYYPLGINDYGADEQKTAARAYITRWRLEPRDWDRYNRGELVEPVKQIVYYIDPATPEKWRKYLKEGVELWQKSFEKIGFKNAIVAKDAPTAEEDPDWSPEDIRYSVIRYITTTIINAQGPHVHDPRSGEIIESDILWYHNVMTWLRCVYLVQTANVNPAARVPKLTDEDMGTMIRFVAAHEVGHTLGFQHNMGASSAYPVDSLRSPSFTKKWGITPSIMDYARANYVAQAGDGDVYLLNDKIGPYDDYAVMWGYKPIQGIKTPEEETVTLNKWITDQAGKRELKFGRQTIGSHIDPTAQTEDLGDDAVKAGTYGIQNLKKIIPNLVQWTSENGKDYQTLSEVYLETVGQWGRYLGHAVHNIGGVYETYKTADQNGVVYEIVPEAKQKAALNFINENGFNTPHWLLNENILRRLEPAGAVERIRQTQVNYLNQLLDPGRMARLIEAESMKGNSAFTLSKFLVQLRKGIWEELSTGKTTDISRRNLQRAYIERLNYLMTQEQQPVAVANRSFFGFVPINVTQSEIRPYIRAELKQLKQDLRSALTRITDAGTRNHAEDAIARIDLILEPKG